MNIDGATPQVPDIQVTSLNPSSANLQGYLISWRDITHLKEIEIELRQANQALNRNLIGINALKATLEEQVIRDPLTNLFNRRFIENVLADEFANAERLAIRTTGRIMKRSFGPLTGLYIKPNHWEETAL